MIPLNEPAWRIVEDVLEQAGTLGVDPLRRDCGALVLDAGVHAQGGYQAGLRLALAGTSGLAPARLVLRELAELPWPHVELSSDQPFLACFACQSAHWPVDLHGARGMGSGPACLLTLPRRFPALEVDGQHAVLVLEARELPDDPVCRELAEACGVAAENLAVLVAPTSSLAGATQIAARSIETALHKLHHLGFDLGAVKSGLGVCPIAQPCGDDYRSLGATNDAMAFGAQVWLSVAGVSDPELAVLAPSIPARASPAYGRPFLETLAVGGGFYAVDPGLFAPAEIVLANLDTGCIHAAGRRDEPRLAAALRGSGG